MISAAVLIELLLAVEASEVISMPSLSIGSDGCCVTLIDHLVTEVASISNALVSVLWTVQVSSMDCERVLQLNATDRTTETVWMELLVSISHELSFNHSVASEAQQSCILDKAELTEDVSVLFECLLS